MNGVLLIDKPKEFTSFDVIAVVRGLTGQRKAGHTGTLDPNATGVLPVLLGSATKAQDLIPNHDKKYIADLKLGMTTDTLDIWGKELTKTESDITAEELESALDGFRGEIWQLPPMFSAVQKNGQRLYDLARKGMEVEREKRKVTVYSLALLEFDRKTQCGKLEVFCSKGTYVRTIIDDIGAKLGVGAVMTDLRRVEACGFSINDCVALSHALEEKLEENDPIENAYILEVSSPGLDRPLKKDKDFIRSIGKLVDIKLFETKEGISEKSFTALLRAFDPDKGTVTLELEDGKEIELARKELAGIRLAVVF